MIPIREIIMFGGAIIGSYTDLKTREVPDLVNYSMMIIGVLISSILTIFNSNPAYIIASFLGLATGWILGSIMFFLRQWGGGDVKMIAGVGALMGLSPQELPGIPLFIAFLILSMVAGAIYGILYLFYLAFKNKKEYLKEYKKISNKKIIKLFKKLYLITTPIIIALMFITKLDMQLTILLIKFLLIIILTFYLAIFGQAISKVSSTKKIKTEELTEGDWINEEIKGIEVSKTGITQEQIQKIKEKGIKTVTVTEGIPFIPSFLFGLILTYLLF